MGSFTVASLDDETPCVRAAAWVCKKSPVWSVSMLNQRKVWAGNSQMSWFLPMSSLGRASGAGGTSVNPRYSQNDLMKG